MALLLGLLVVACGGDDSSEEAGGPPVLVAFAPNSAQAGAEATVIRLIELAGSERQAREIGEPAFYRQLRFSPDGYYLAALGSESAGGAPWVRIYNVETGEGTAADLEPGAIAGMEWSADGSHLAIVHETSLVLLEPSGSYTVDDGVGLAPGANPLRWAWTPDGEVFGVITEDELRLVPIRSSEPGTGIARADFPGDTEDWALRSGEEPREIGLVDLRPVSGIPEGRAEYPILISGDGTLEDSEPRIVSIYDWNTLPSPEFDAATDRQFPLVRKMCSPCRSADGASSLFVLWVNESISGPPADGEDWPEGTQTLLAIELGPEDATAVDLGLAPEGVIDVAAGLPVYDVVRTRE